MAGPISDLSNFSEALRSRGLVVTPDQTADMTRSLLLVDPGDRGQVHSALRSLAITDPSQRALFDEEFARFFGGRLPEALEVTRVQPVAATASIAAAPILKAVDTGEPAAAADQTGASEVEMLGDRDFSDLDDDDLAAARRLVMTMHWEPTNVRTRRWQRDPHGNRPDMRRTLRAATGPGGAMMPIRFRERRMRRRPLIIIADVSGSMERYAELFLVFAHAARQRLRHVEVFTFSTDLTRITEQMARRDTRSALAEAGKMVEDWSGGTRIGAALGRWNVEWSRRLARGGPVVLILSDGWDCGEPDDLEREMGRLARSVHKVIWLNPLAARDDYVPATRGMRSVLPHVDHLLPAASVNDLRDVVRLLETIDGRASR